jgi:hypothetical protein
VNHILLLLTTLLLLASEIGILQKWFSQYLPLLGPTSALVTLGIIQVFPGGFESHLDCFYKLFAF